MKNTSKLGFKLYQARINKKITVEQLAEKIHKDPRTIYYYESGMKSPSLETFAGLCRILEASSDELLSGEFVPGD